MALFVRKGGSRHAGQAALPQRNIHLSRNKLKLGKISTIILLSVLPIALICALQFFKVDIYRYIYSGEEYNFTFSLGNVYGPFYNINYVGSYVVLMLPFVIAVVLSAKMIWQRTVALLVGIMLLISIYGSYSSTGMIALGAIICLGILILGVKFIPNKKSRQVAFWLTIAVIVIIGSVVGSKYIRNYFDASNTGKNDFQYVITNTDYVEFGYKDHSYKISMPYDEAFGYYLWLRDETDDMAMHAETDEAGTYYVPEEEALNDLKIRPVSFSNDSSQYGIELIVDACSLYFSNQVSDMQCYYYMTPTGSWTTISEENQSKSFQPLTSLSGLANGRGYIWNKTITLIPKYLLFGSGADTFACAYPNNDFISKMNNGYYNLVITKPHNMYLQYTIQSGLISLICLLVLFGWYFIATLHVLLTEPFDSTEKKINFALFLGLIGYMITGIANDSTVTVAPVFWVLFGFSMALTNRIKKAESH